MCLSLKQNMTIFPLRNKPPMDVSLHLTHMSWTCIRITFCSGIFTYVWLCFTFIFLVTYQLHYTFQTSVCEIVGWLSYINCRHTMVYIMLYKSYSLNFMLVGCTCFSKYWELHEHMLVLHIIEFIDIFKLILLFYMILFLFIILIIFRIMYINLCFLLTKLYLVSLLKHLLKKNKDISYYTIQIC